MASAEFYGRQISVQDAASYLKVTPQTIYNYIRKGYLSATDISHGTDRPIWGINEKDIIDFDMRKHAIKKGRKKGSKNKTGSHKKEIAELRKEISEISEALFVLCLRLDDLAREGNDE